VRAVTRAPVTRTWYRLALGGATPALVAAAGEHLGTAVAAAEAHAPGSFVIAAEPAHEADIPLGESVGKQHAVALASPPELAEVPVFRWPVGVLPQLSRASGVAGARRGWIVRPDPELLVIEAQTDGAHIIDAFMSMIERLPSADNLEVRVLDHFEDAGRTDVWLTSRLDAKRILRFMDDHDAELIGNGHVELGVYVRAHKATLKLTEHKTIVWVAEGGALQADVQRWLGEIGIPAVDALVTVTDAPHYHYKPAKSRDRKRLGEELYRQRLRRVDTVKSDAP